METNLVAVSKMWQWMDRQVVVSHSMLFQGFRDSPVRARIVAMAVRMGNTYQRGPRGLIVKTLWRQKGHLRHLTAPPKRRHCAAARSSRRVRRVVGEQQGADCASPPLCLAVSAGSVAARHGERPGSRARLGLGLR